MNETYSTEEFTLVVCGAIITRNHRRASELIKLEQSDALLPELRSELEVVAQENDASTMSKWVQLSYYLPAWMQYIGQRMVLLSPRFGYWVLRKTKLHHRWY